MDAKPLILIVEDETAILEMLSDLLEMSGFNTLKARDGLEGLEIYKNMTTKPSLIVFDIFMPRKSGIDLYNELNQLGTTSKFLAISGFTDKREITDFLKENNIPYMHKPFQFSDFMKEIKRILANGSL